MATSPYISALQTYYNTVSKTYNTQTRSMHGSSALGLISAAGPSIQPGSWVLDLATGSGKVALAAAAKVGNTGHVLGIDISEELLETAKRSARDAGVEGFAEFIEGEVTQLALPEEKYAGKRCFDAVTCGNAIGMLPSPRKMLENVARYTKPGGVFVADIMGPHVPAKLFLEVAVPRGFSAPIRPQWLSDPEAAFREAFERSMFEMQSCTANETTEVGRWNASDSAAMERLWEIIAVESSWVSFGLGSLDGDVREGIKEAWMEKLGECKGADGFVVSPLKRHVAVAVLKS
ncbi:S-adenosyl-L-methionine-dependent methyltransferase [Periconia macrospinosa]|uniref:S-adenosyl-L-methionine-dependent methyltransferase n=1 Tax=Periconia macrospinosa TaxID=97972 RepID=A0A2V1DSD2_9PLEO|nr:S-adenosyl-L-methionine-dependent methyltransferase [Periconia macrospinosa]